MSILSAGIGRQPEALNDKPERSALLASRRLNIAGFAAVGAVIQVIASVSAFDELTSAQALASIASIALVVTGIAGRSTSYLWLTVLGAAVLVGSNALPTNGAQWLFINSAALFGAFALGTLVSRRWLPVAAVGCLVGLHSAWAAQPAAVIATGFSAWNGWIPPIQAALLCIAAHAMWSRTTRTAVALDRLHGLDQERIAIERERAERGRALRAAAIRIHESLLNEIRYVLNVEHPDRDRLTAVLQSMQESADGPLSHGSATTLADDVTTRSGLTFRLAFSQNSRDAVLDPQTYEALCAALVEFARNRARHDRVSFIEAHAHIRGEQISVRIPNARLNSDDSPGIGLNTVISANLRDVAGEASVDALGVIITVPFTRPSSMAVEADANPFARGRTLMTFALGSLTLTGVLYFAALLTETQLGARGIVTLALASSGAIVALALPLTSRSLSAPLAAVLAVPVIAVPLTLSGAMPSRDCVPLAQTTASALNITGFMILVTGLWCLRRWMVVPMLGAWLAAIAWYLTHVTRDCGEYLLIPILNSILIMPVVIVVVSAATSIYTRAGDERARAREEQRQRLALSMAQQEVNRHLQNLVERATHQLLEIAQSESPTVEQRQRLRCIEAMVRASVQVDVQTAGTFAVLALELVEQAALDEIPVDVRALEVSDDLTPIPEIVRDYIRDFIALSRGGLTRLSAFTDGQRDYLTVSISRPMTSELAFAPELSMTVQGIELSVDAAQPEVGMERGLVLMAMRDITGDGH